MLRIAIHLRQNAGAARAKTTEDALARAARAEAALADDDTADRCAAAEARAARAARLAELEQAIEAAVEAEDYDRADELNTAADGLRAELDAL